MWFCVSAKIAYACGCVSGGVACKYICVVFDSAREKERERVRENETITSIRTPTEMILVPLVILPSSTRKDARAPDSKGEEEGT